MNVRNVLADELAAGQDVPVDGLEQVVLGGLRPERQLRIQGEELEGVLRDRRRLMFNGNIVATLVLDNEGELLADPAIVLQGLPGCGKDGDLPGLVEHAIETAIERWGRGALRHDDRIEEAARVAARRVVKSFCGKRPVTEIRVLRLED